MVFLPKLRLRGESLMMCCVRRALDLRVMVWYVSVARDLRRRINPWMRNRPKTAKQRLSRRGT